MFGWIPIIGPIIEGIVSVWSKTKDVELAKYKENTTREVENARASVRIVEATKDDIGLRILRDAAITPPVVWSMLIGWDTIVALHYPWLQFHVAPYPQSVNYIPGLALGFLLGNLGLNAWLKRR